MEVLLNWNVYKVFKNGRRAKAPITTFEYDGSETEAEAHFRAVILENFKEKYRDWNYSLLNATVPQERDDALQQDDEKLRKQTLVLSRLAREKNITCKSKTVGGLIFAAATHWNWQWCVLEYPTNNFVAALSPSFENPTEAQKWMDRQTRNLK